MNKPTVHDIAKEAGVSLATVDRVLNTRPGVRDQTIKRVREAVQRLGYVRDTYAANLARQRHYRFVFVLPEGPNQFVETLKEALLEATHTHLAERMLLETVSVPTRDPHAVVRALNGLAADMDTLDGVAIMAPETPHIRDAVARLKSAGVVVVALASDLPNSRRDHFVGTNSLAAGRTAASLMGRFVQREPSSVLVVTNSILSRDSIDRRLGFDQVMAARFPKIRALPTLEFHDDTQRLARVLNRALGTYEGLAGVYSLGSGNRPLLDILRESRRLRDLVVIAHELTPATRRALLNDEVGAVIAQNVGHLVRSALRIIRAKCDGVDILEAQERIRVEIVIRENLPP